MNVVVDARVGAWQVLVCQREKEENGACTLHMRLATALIDHPRAPPSTYMHTQRQLPNLHVLPAAQLLREGEVDATQLVQVPGRKVREDGEGGLCAHVVGACSCVGDCVWRGREGRR